MGVSHGDEPGKTCHFGHVVMPVKGEIDHELKKRVQSGEIGNLDQLRNAGNSIGDLCGNPYKTVKVISGSQGAPRAAAFQAVDKLDDDLDYTAKKLSESIFVSPQSQLHSEYMQRKNQAEQNVRDTMRNISNLIQQKHMLEHDIRKLRTRAENMRSGDENILKGDFIELVDGAGAAGGQGGDEASLKFYRDNNIYPSIVADFQEMSSLEDLEEGEKLGELPNNEKAILRKKWAMYEKWKDLYGSEIQRKLKELKQQLKSIERSIDETEEWLEPYVRDVKMINEKSRDELKAEFSHYFDFRGTSTQFRTMEFVAYRPMVNGGRMLEVVEDGSNATHYRMIYIHVTHINLAGFEQPQTPAQGPSVAIIKWHPVVICRHVFEKFFQKRVEEHANQFEQVLKDYHGELQTERGSKIQEARSDKGFKVREVREKIKEELDREIPVEFSSTLRRVEDGIDTPNTIEKRYGEGVLEALETVLEIELGEEDEDADEEMYRGIQKELREFTGLVDEFKIPASADPVGDFQNHFKFDFYYDFKVDLGLFVMN